MTVTAFWYGRALAKALGGTAATGVPSFDWLSDTIKVGLLGSAYTPDQDAHTLWSAVDSREVTGTGYTAGGATLGTKTLGYTDGTNVIKLDAADTTWPTSAITARYAVVYKAGSTASTSPLLGYVDFGANVVSNAGTFTITWATGGIFTITPA